MNKVNGILECKTLFFIMSFYVGLWTIRMPDIKDQLNTAVNNIIEHLTIQGKLDPDNMARIKTATEHINKTIQ